MDFVPLLIIAFPIVIWAIVAWHLQSKTSRGINEQFIETEGFHPALNYENGATGSGIAIDVDNKKIVVIDSVYGKIARTEIPFASLIAAEVVRDGDSITKTNRGSPVLGAVVGGVLLGPAGLLLGGLTGSKRTRERVERLTLRLTTNNLVEPVHEVVFLNHRTQVRSIVFQSVSKELEAWYGRMRTILEASDFAGTQVS